MMHTIRNAAKPVYVVVIAAFVGTIIFAWGMDITSKGKRPPNAVGKINGREISLDMFYNSYESRYNDFLKDNPDPSDEDYKRLRDETWNSIVSQTLLAQQIRENNITMTDEELAEYVKYVPPRELYEYEDLQTDGKFDQIKYQNFLQNLASSPDPRAEQQLFWIEQSVKSQILVSKLQELILNTAVVSKQDIYEQYRDQNEKVKVKYIFISESNVDTSDINITDDELLARYEQDKESKYKTDETATLRYVSIDKKPSQADMDSVKQEIYTLYEKIKKGEDFAKLAEKYSQDASGKDGGDLGWFGKGRMVKPFEEAVFALKKIGDVSEPVKTQFGWHIIKLTGKRTNKNKKGENEPEVKASHILLKTELSAKTLAKLKEKAEKLREQAIADGFDTMAEANKLDVKETRPFSPGGFIPGIGPNQELNEFAFKAKKGSISNVIDNRKSLIFATPGTRKPAGYVSFEEIKDQIYSKIHREKVVEKTYVKGEEFYQLMTSKNLTFEQMAKKAGLPVLETKKYFTRNEFVENVGRDPAFIGAAFNLSKQNRFSKPVKARSGCYLMELIDKQEIDEQKYSAIADSLYNDARKKSRQEAWSQWYKNIYKNSEIEDFREDVFGS